MFKDIRYSVRSLLKRPGFTIVALLTLALGIGANTTIFSIGNALLLKPFPFTDLERLVLVRESLPNQDFKATGVSPADFFDWQRQNKSFRNWRPTALETSRSPAPVSLNWSVDLLFQRISFEQLEYVRLWAARSNRMKASRAEIGSRFSVMRSGRDNLPAIRTS
jgi:hypothetical protein